MRPFYIILSNHFDLTTSPAQSAYRKHQTSPSSYIPSHSLSTKTTTHHCSMNASDSSQLADRSREL